MITVKNGLWMGGLLLLQSSVVSAAINCKLNEDSCVLKQKQLRAITDAGIQPTKIVDVSADNRAESKNPDLDDSTLPKMVQQPFSIPKPQYNLGNNSTEMNTPSNQNNNKSNNSNLIMNIFTPGQNPGNENIGQNDGKNNNSISTNMIRYQ